MVIADVTATGDDNVLDRRGQRHLLSQGATPPAPGGSHRDGRRPQDRRLHHRSRPQRLPHGPAELRQGQRRPARLPNGMHAVVPARPTRPAARRHLRASQPQSFASTSTSKTACIPTTSSTSARTGASLRTTPRRRSCSTSCALRARAEPSPSPRSAGYSTRTPRTGARWGRIRRCSPTPSAR